MSTYFSIIIPTLNEEQNLPILLQNLTVQTFTDFEIIHIDGSSIDQTIKTAQKFSNLINIHSIVVTKRNVCFQRNEGASKANGKWLIFMDADDQISNNFLSECKKMIAKKQPDVFIPFYNPDVNKVSYHLLTGFANFISLVTKNSKTPFITEALLGIKKDVFNEIGGFDERIKVHEGSQLILAARRLGYKYSVFIRPRYLNSMRRAEKFGVLKLLKNNFIIAIKILMGKEMIKSEVKNLYKMDGGSVYKK